MLQRYSLRPWLLSLVCVALLFVRVWLGGAHLHLCFDGSEPAASLHLMDDDQHHALGADTLHHDVDLALVGEALTESAKIVLDLPTLLIVALLAWSLRQTRRPLASSYRLPLFPSATRFLRPPLRGPPRLISL